MSQIVEMTDAAKDYLDSVRPDDGHITLTINGGGCAGFTYKWGTTDEWKEKDVETKWIEVEDILLVDPVCCLLYTSPSPRDLSTSRMPSSA